MMNIHKRSIGRSRSTEKRERKVISPTRKLHISHHDDGRSEQAENASAMEQPQWCEVWSARFVGLVEQ